MINGRFKHVSTYTVLDLGEYDVVLGMPFLTHHQVAISWAGKLPEIEVKTPKGPRFLPLRADKGRGPAIYHMHTIKDLQKEVNDNDTLYQLHLQPGLVPLEDDSGADAVELNFTWTPPTNGFTSEPEILANDEATPGPSFDKVSEKSDKNSRNRTNLKSSSTSHEDVPETFDGSLSSKKIPRGQETLQLNELRHSEPRQPGIRTRRRPERVWHENPPKQGPSAPSTDPLDSVPRPKDVPELEKLLQQFRDVFPADLPLELPPDREISMRIPVKEGNTPPCQAPYRLHEDAKKTVEETLKYLYEHGLVRDSFSEYGAPVTLAKKPDGTWRFCTDYRRLNAITKEAKYPLPRIDESLDHLKSAKYFSKLDLRSGYWQVRIHPDDVEKSAFRTHMGHHEWLVVPFGLQGAPSCFQRLMNHYLLPYLGRFVIVYLDDILVYSQTKEEHLEHLRRVLETLRDKQLFAKASKCDLLRTRVSFLGFIVESGKISTDPSKVEVMKNWKVPETVRELRSFLGLCNFYRKFVEHYAEIAKPLTDILRSTEFEEKFGHKFTKTAPISLGEPEQAAFQRLKDALTSAPCLVIYNPTKPTEVWADASSDNACVGAVLMQDHGKGFQPVAYLSKVLNDTQEGYATFEQELLALRLAFEEWKHYLAPIRFVARTDHNGLKYLRTQKTLNDRQWNWIGYFSEFDFELVYRAGKNMEVPDALSRRTPTKGELSYLLRICDSDNDRGVEITIPTDKGPTKVILNMEVKKQDPTMSNIDVSKFDYSGDKDFGDIFKLLSKNPKQIFDKPSLQLYSLEGTLLFWADRSSTQRICVPKNQRIQVLKEFHDTPLGGHFGVDKTFETLRRHFYWPKMKRSVHEYVTSCDQCQKNKIWTHKRFRNPQLPDIPTEPWHTVSIDFCGPFPKTTRGHDEVCSISCTLTGEALFVPCQTTITAKQTAQLFVEHAFRVKGLPQRIISDRGPQFIADFWQNFWNFIGTTASLTAPYHPQSNPVERKNQNFETGLKSFVNAQQDDWDERLILFEFAFNNSVNPSTGQTPFFLNTGRHPRLPALQGIDTPQPAVTDYVTFLHNEIMAARDCLKYVQGYNADHQAGDFARPDFKVGDQVLLSTENLNLQLPSKKLQPRWIGPLRIKQLRGPNTVLIEVPPRLTRLEPLQNVYFLKPYKTRPTSLGPQKAELPPEVIEGEEEFEVEDILSHRLHGNTVQYLVRFKSYGPEEDLWLPAKNLRNAPNIVEEYHKRNPLTKTRPTQHCCHAPSTRTKAKQARPEH